MPGLMLAPGGLGLVNFVNLGCAHLGTAQNCGVREKPLYKAWSLCDSLALVWSILAQRLTAVPLLPISMFSLRRRDGTPVAAGRRSARDPENSLTWSRPKCRSYCWKRSGRRSKRFAYDLRQAALS
ncbi:hypothetical protein BKA80DRAFT_53082 [Phyllosticta citrichinensis]